MLVRFIYCRNIERTAICVCVVFACSYSVTAGVSFGLSVIINPIIGLHHTLLNCPPRASLSRSNPHYKIRRLLLFVNGWVLEFFTWLFSLSPSNPSSAPSLSVWGALSLKPFKDHKYLNTIISVELHLSAQTDIKVHLHMMGIDVWINEGLRHSSVFLINIFLSFSY